MNPPENKFKPIVLTDKQLKWLDKHFKHTKNADVAQKLGVSLRSVNRLAERRGLKKSKQFMTKCQENATAKAHESNLRNGTYPPKGYRIPNSEKGQFRKGERPIDRLGAKKEAERVVKAAESFRKTWRLEKARALYGLPRQTKLRVVKRPTEQIAQRYYLRKRGYIVERGSNTAYYTAETKRSVELESRPRSGFTFLSMEERIND